MKTHLLIRRNWNAKTCGGRICPPLVPWKEIIESPFYQDTLSRRNAAEATSHCGPQLYAIGSVRRPATNDLGCTS